MVCLRPPEILPLVMNLESISEWHLFQGLRREKLPANKVSANLNFEREKQPELWKMGQAAFVSVRPGPSRSGSETDKLKACRLLFI